MKSVYKLGDDIFIAVAFVTFIIGTVLKFLGITNIGYADVAITDQGIIIFSVICFYTSIFWSCATSITTWTVNIIR